jgi:hypothetical protein
MTRERILSRDILLLLGVVIALELIAPFYVRSYGVDGPSQLNLLKQFSGLFASGVYVPRWVPTGYFGFGAVSFYFYPPLSLYIGSIIRVATGIADERMLFELTGLVATIGSFFSAAYLLRSLAASRSQQWLGAALYAFAPMQVAELYSRASLSTHVGCAFLPLVWAGAIAATAPSKAFDLRASVLLAVASALIALSSVPLAMLTGVSMLIVVVVYRQRIMTQAILNILFAGALAVVLYASQLTAILSAQRFARIEDLIVTNPEYLLAALLRNTAWSAGYHVGILFFSVMLIAVAFYRSKEKHAGSLRKFIQAGILLTAVIAILEIPVMTKWLWSMVPPFTIIQGIWRFYVQLMLFVAIFVAVAHAETMQRAARILVRITMIGALIPICFVIFDIHVFRQGESNYNDPPEYRTIYTGSYQQTLSNTKLHADDPPVMRSTTNAATLATFHQFYWPYWHLYSGEHEIATRPDSMGRAVAQLPEGSNTLTWRLERTPLERVGLWVSGIAWGALLFLGAPMLLFQRVRKKQHSTARA